MRVLCCVLCAFLWLCAVCCVLLCLSVTHIHTHTHTHTIHTHTGPLIISPEIAQMRDTQLAARESTFTVSLLNRVEDGVALPAPETRQLLLNKVCLNWC